MSEQETASLELGDSPKVEVAVNEERTGDQIVHDKITEIQDRRDAEDAAENEGQQATTDDAVEDSAPAEQEQKAEEFSESAVAIASAFGISESELPKTFKNEKAFINYAATHTRKLAVDGVAKDAEQKKEPDPEPEPVKFADPLEGRDEDEEVTVKDMRAFMADANERSVKQTEENKQLREQLDTQVANTQRQQAKDFETQYETWHSGDDSAKAIIKTPDDAGRHVEAIVRLAKTYEGAKLPPLAVLAKTAMAMEFGDELAQLGKTNVSKDIHKRNGTPMGRPTQNRRFVVDKEALRSSDPRVREKAVNAALDQRIKEKKADTGVEPEPWDRK